MTSSKLRPMRLEWSEERCIVWKGPPWRVYLLRLSMTSDQRTNPVPFSTRTSWICRFVRDLVLPGSWKRVETSY